MTETPRGCVALTGASGFVGGAIARRLAADGWHLRLMVRAGSEERTSGFANAQVVTGGLADRPAIERLLAGATALVHCAGAVRGARYADFERVNVAGTQALLDAAAPTLRVVHISSLAARHPQLSHYAASKRAGEQRVTATLPVQRRVILRPPAVYGTQDRELRPLLDAMWRGLALLPGPPSARFSLLYADDLARLVACLLASDAGWGTIHEPHDGKPGGYSWSELLAAVEQLRGRPVRSMRLPGGLLSAFGFGNAMLSRLTGSAPMLSPGKARELRWPDWIAAGNASLVDTAWAPSVDLTAGLRTLFAPSTASDMTVGG